MSETVESYRMALESEIGRWSGFAKVLRMADREAFDELMDMVRINTVASCEARDPIIFESFMRSISQKIRFIAHYIQQVGNKI